MKKNHQSIVLGVTFAVFLTEAILHYNIGKDDMVDEDEREKMNGRILPPAKSFLKVAGVVFVFAYLNSVIINQLTKE